MKLTVLTDEQAAYLGSLGSAYRDIGQIKNGMKYYRLALKLYRDLDHLFKREPGDSTPARYLDATRRVDPTFLGDLTTWLTSQVKP